ncbi:hypothetical protein BDZ91DRAFT_744144 [Kalaharituber pfeilii]|nr:hypothetical protein BDZ91DRAFT_744144 [Kalaharituber pfeilii]
MDLSGQPMDFAAAVAKGGPHRANPVDTVIPQDTSTSSLVDVDSGVTVVPSDFRSQPVKTETQATRLSLEEEAAAAAAAVGQNRQRRSNKDHQAAGVAKKQVQKAESYAHSHPLTLVNSLLGGVAAVVLGVGAWKKWKVGELNWRVVGIWGGIAAAVAAVDVLASKFYLRRASK